jgi:putative ABC transport system permease protein
VGKSTPGPPSALRALGRSPGFSLTVISTLGLGIGANAAMFNTVDRLMFRPLAYLRDPAHVHRIYWQWQDRGATTTSLSTHYARASPSWALLRTRSSAIW